MQSLTELPGKEILVTGATSGIGTEIASALSGAGSAVSITGRNSEMLAELSEKLGKTNPRFRAAIKADLTIDEDIQQLVEQLPVLNGLVLCAGVIDYTPAKMISRAKMERIFSVNLFSSILLIQQLLKTRKMANGASLVFVSSVSALTGVVGTSLYAASKAAVNSYAKVLAAELAPRNIRVNVVSPGVVKTKLIENENVLDTAGIRKMEDAHPLGLGMPSDVASLVRFLLADQSSWITGSNIVIDGGYMIN